MSQRKIAKAVWTSVSTVNDHIKLLPKSNKNEHIEKILEKDINIVNLALDELERRFKDKNIKEALSTRDIISSADVSAKRYSLFKWEATDPNGGLKSIHDLTFDSMW